MQLLVCFCHICQASCLILVYTKGRNQASDMYRLSAHISNEHCRRCWGCPRCVACLCRALPTAAGHQPLVGAAATAAVSGAGNELGFPP